MVEPRTPVKVLSSDSGVRRVAVVDRKGKFGPGYWAATAQGCWVVAEAVVR
jgi:hypothetical protein